MLQKTFFTVNKELFIFKTLRTFQTKICLQFGQVQLLENHFSAHARQKKWRQSRRVISLPTVTSSRHTLHLSPSSDRSASNWSNRWILAGVRPLPRAGNLNLCRIILKRCSQASRLSLGRTSRCIPSLIACCSRSSSCVIRTVVGISGVKCLFRNLKI